MNQTSPGPAVPVCMSPKGAGLRQGEDRYLQKRCRGSARRGWHLVSSAHHCFPAPRALPRAAGRRQRGRQVRICAAGWWAASASFGVACAWTEERDLNAHASPPIPSHSQQAEPSLPPIRKRATAPGPGRHCSRSALVQEGDTPELRSGSQGKCWGSPVGWAPAQGRGAGRYAWWSLAQVAGSRGRPLLLASTHLWPCPGPERLGRAGLAGLCPPHPPVCPSALTPDWGNHKLRT